MVIILTFLIAVSVTAVGLLLLGSSGKIRPVRDARGNPLPNSIAEKIWVNINGIRQGMFVRSTDAAHPVLLFLHGGPAMPTYSLEKRYPTGLEQDFTVIWWEQRGAGLSFSSDIPPETMTVEQNIDDTVALADYLRTRFGKSKIYLMGHSWGSFIGIQAAAKAPDRFHAYIGVGQLTNQLTSEQLAYAYMLDEYRARGNAAMVRKLEAARFEATIPLPPSYMAVRDAAMHRLGVGTTRDMRSVISGMFVPTWLNGEYTLREKLNIWRGKWSVCSSQLWNEVLRTDITAVVPRLEIPVYFLHGKFDYTTSYALMKPYFEKLQAPLKAFYTFEDSAHSPVFEDPERTRMILKTDVLAGTNSHSDAEEPRMSR